MSIEVEKTHFLTIDDKTVPVSSLPDNIKEHVKLFDALRQDVMDQSYKLNVYQMAAEYKKHQLEQMMQKYITEQEKEEAKRETSKKVADSVEE